MSAKYPEVRNLAGSKGRVSRAGERGSAFENAAAKAPLLVAGRPEVFGVADFGRTSSSQRSFNFLAISEMVGFWNLARACTVLPICDDCKASSVTGNLESAFN